MLGTEGFSGGKIFIELLNFFLMDFSLYFRLFFPLFFGIIVFLLETGFGLTNGVYVS